MPFSTHTTQSHIPRIIPLETKLAVFYRINGFILGCLLFLIGFVFMVAGFFFCDLTSYFYYKQAETTDGKIVQWLRTDIRQNHHMIMKYVFEYKVEGKQYSSYSYGSEDPLQSSFIKVRYLREDRSSAVIAGMRKKVFPAQLLIVPLFFIAGGFAVVWRRRKKGLRTIELLRNGIYAQGTIHHILETGNEGDSFQIVYTFISAEGYTKHGSADVTDWGSFKKDQQVQILYDPASPENSAIADTLPRSLKEFLQHNY